MVERGQESSPPPGPFLPSAGAIMTERGPEGSAGKLMTNHKPATSSRQCSQLGSHRLHSYSFRFQRLSTGLFTRPKKHQQRELWHFLRSVSLGWALGVWFSSRQWDSTGACRAPLDHWTCSQLCLPQSWPGRSARSEGGRPGWAHRHHGRMPAGTALCAEGPAPLSTAEHGRTPVRLPLPPWPTS